jgi:hypothetical protein
MKKTNEVEGKIFPHRPSRVVNMRPDGIASMLRCHHYGLFVDPGDLIYRLDKTLIPNYPDDYKGRRRKPPMVMGDDGVLRPAVVPKPKRRRMNAELRRSMDELMLELHYKGHFVNPKHRIYRLDKTLIPNYPDDYKGRRRKPQKVEGDVTP